MNFDPEEFLNTTFTEATSTRPLPIPAGDWDATVEDIKMASGVTARGANIGKPWLRLDVIWTIDSLTVLEEMGRSKVSIRQGIMLEVDETGMPDKGKGKNPKLGRLREAFGLNQPGVPFQYSMLIGRSAKIKVTQRIEGEDIYNDVDGVARAA